MSARKTILCIGIGWLAATIFVSMFAAWPLACAHVAVWLERAQWADADAARSIGRSLVVLPFFGIGFSALAWLFVRAFHSEATS